MEVRITPEQEAHLTQLAQYEGKEAAEFIQETVNRLLDEDIRFRTAVQTGIEQADRGEFIEDEEMSARVASWFAA